MATTRRTLFAAGLAMVAMSTGASAHAVKSWQVSGMVPGKCKVGFLCNGGMLCSNASFSVRSEDEPEDDGTAGQTGTLRWECNFAGQGITLSFVSANHGYLVASQGSTSRKIHYHASFTATNASSFTDAVLDTPKSTVGMPSAALTYYTGQLKLRRDGKSSDDEAGTYTDMISVTITPSGL